MGREAARRLDGVAWRGFRFLRPSGRGPGLMPARFTTPKTSLPGRWGSSPELSRLVARYRATTSKMESSGCPYIHGRGFVIKGIIPTGLKKNFSLALKNPLYRKCCHKHNFNISQYETCLIYFPFHDTERLSFFILCSLWPYKITRSV